jgi:hypothetical protein
MVDSAPLRQAPGTLQPGGSVGHPRWSTVHRAPCEQPFDRAERNGQRGLASEKARKREVSNIQ